MLSFEEFTQTRNCEDFTQQIIDATEGYAELTQIGVVDDHQIFKVVINPEGKRTVAFVAGLHGDEPGGPVGVLEFLKERPYIPKTKRVVIIPLANPTGYKANTRKNKDDVDINRKFNEKELTGEAKAIWEALEDEDLTVFHSLHEDPDLSKFYLYYTHNKKLAEDMRDLARKYFKIYEKDQRKPLSGEMYGDKIIDGLIPLPHIKRGTIEDRMLEYSVPYFTTETPGKAPLVKRAKFTKEVMKLVIHSL